MAATDVLLGSALARDPAGPLVTYYDDATDERTELSATTLANWVAKTANLLQDELGLAAGDRVAILLPAHWQTVAVLLAAWSAGGVLSTDPADAAVVFTDLARAPQALAAGAAEVLTLSLTPLAQLSSGPAADQRSPVPAGTRDYAVEVRAHGDRFVPNAAVPAHAPALDLGGDRTTSAADLVEVARRRAAELGLLDGDRVLVAGDWSTPADWVDGLLAPLAASASIVLCANVDPEELPRRAAAERVTASLGVTLPGIRPL